MPSSSSHGGFTLVELAIVLMIIGLLIGGVLRGREMLENARVVGTLQQIPTFDVAFTAFRGSYQAIPGDMANAGTRIANCTDWCAMGGNGDGRIGNNDLISQTDAYSNGTASSPDRENVTFWNHLAGARLLRGVDPKGGTDGSGAMRWDQNMPSAKIGGGFHIAQVGIPAVSGGTGGANGFYVVLRPDAGNSGDTTASVNFPASGGVITPAQAQRLDAKKDDGLPRTGDIIGVGGSLDCTGATYNENAMTTDCGVIIRISG